MAVITLLKAYWPLDETSGTREDAHGANDLTDNNTVSSGTGKVGTAADFEADNNESLSIVDNADLRTGDIDFSVSIWVKFETASSYPIMMAKSNGASDDEYTLFCVGASLVPRFQVQYNTSNSQYAEWNAALSTGTWYHIVGWHDSVNNVLGITVNDATPITQAHSLGVNSGAQAFAMGRASGVNLDGMLDEAGFWKKVLTPTEITWLYNSGNGRNYAAIVAESGGSNPARLVIEKA
jgi:hypothetical protein